VLFEVSQRFSRLSTPGSDQAVLPLKTYVSGRAAKQKCACRPGNRSATAATGAVHSGAPDFGRDGDGSANRARVPAALRPRSLSDRRRLQRGERVLASLLDDDVVHDERRLCVLVDVDA